MLATSDKRPSSGAIGAQTGTKAITYTYNADGYVTASAADELYLTITEKTIREQITTTENFAYENGRLSTRNTKRTNQYGNTTNTTESFAYNSTGELITKTVGSASPQIWTYRNNQLVDYLQKSGASELRPITVQNGLVTKFMLPGTDGDFVVAYTYDNQQQVVKTEESLGGVPTNSYAQTYSNAKPAEASLPLFKGWPVVTQEYGRAGVLRTKMYSYRNTVSGKTAVFSEQTSAPQTNSQGFITTNIITVKHPNPASAEQDYTTTETYTYSGCQ